MGRRAEVKERDFVEKIQGCIKADPALRGSVVFKHAETLTSGIPDISITALGHICWIEVKYLRKNKRLKDIVGQLQVVTCFQLAQHCGGRAWIVVYEERPKQLTIWTPRALANHLWPKLVPLDDPKYHQPYVAPGADPESTPRGLLSMAESLRYFGAVRFDGHPHEKIAQLVKESVT